MSAFLTARDFEVLVAAALRERVPAVLVEVIAGVVLVGTEFKTIKLSEYLGRWVVLFFYPLDFTFVCPTEIKEFSRREEDFRRLNAVVLGCSVDSKHSHKAWVSGTLGPLTFPLLSDPDRTVLTAYGAYGEKLLYGKLVEGVIRSTFVVDVDAKGKGTVAVAQYNVRAAGHVDKLKRELGV